MNQKHCQLELPISLGLALHSRTAFLADRVLPDADTRDVGGIDNIGGA